MTARGQNWSYDDVHHDRILHSRRSGRHHLVAASRNVASLSNYRFVRGDSDKPNPFVDVRKTLRDALLEITRDGDFQSCAVYNGSLSISRTRRTATTCTTRVRSFDLSRFPSVADMVSG